jgi:predicted small lipoprotein YifL
MNHPAPVLAALVPGRAALPALAALAALLALAGCGQKGTLYLPDRKKSTVPAAVPAQAPDSPGAPAPVPPAPSPPA